MAQMNSLPDWFHTRPQKDGYFIRFKYVFGDNDQDKQAFIDLWPSPLKNIAEEVWPIMCNLYPDLYLNANTIQKAKGLIAKEAWKWKGQYKRLSEVNNLSLREFFSQDIINVRERDASTHSNASTTGSTSSNTNGDNVDYDINNDAEIDDKTGEVLQWKDPRFADSANSNTNSTNGNSNTDTKSDSSNHFNDRSEKTNTQYDANAIMKLMKLSTDPNVYFFAKFITGISASIQTSTETLHNWEGEM